MALQYARYGYVLENGRVVLDGDARSLSENEDVKEFYSWLIRRSGGSAMRDFAHWSTSSDEHIIEFL